MVAFTSILSHILLDFGHFIAEFGVQGCHRTLLPVIYCIINLSLVWQWPNCSVFRIPYHCPHLLVQVPFTVAYFVFEQEDVLNIKSTNDLPHLRNPEILVGENDLTSLSYLHEPAGM